MNVRTERRILAAIAAEGVLKTADAERLGILRATLARAADEGLIRRLARGKYASIDTPLPDLRTEAALVGDDAVLAYRGAGGHFGLDAIPKGVREWIVPHGGSRPRHLPANVSQRRRFDELDIITIEGVRVTSVAQTLADLGARLDADYLERAAESALRKDLVNELALRDFANLYVFARHGGPMLRNVLDRRPIGAKPTDSDIETRLLQVYRAGGLPRHCRQWPVYNADGTFEAFLDCGFPAYRFGTEVDGFETHGTRHALQYDLNRQNRVGDTGVTFRRFTYDDVAYRPHYVCAQTWRALAMAAR